MYEEVSDLQLETCSQDAFGLVTSAGAHIIISFDVFYYSLITVTV